MGGDKKGKAGDEPFIAVICELQGSTALSVAPAGVLFFALSLFVGCVIHPRR